MAVQAVVLKDIDDREVCVLQPASLRDRELETCRGAGDPFAGVLLRSQRSPLQRQRVTKSTRSLLLFDTRVLHDDSISDKIIPFIEYETPVYIDRLGLWVSREGFFSIASPKRTNLVGW